MHIVGVLERTALHETEAAIELVERRQIHASGVVEQIRSEDERAGGDGDVRLLVDEAGMILPSIWPPEAIIELPGGRIRISAPTPRARLACSFSIPSLKPTSVRTIVTWMLMATTAQQRPHGTVFQVFENQFVGQAICKKPPGVAGTGDSSRISLRANPALRNIFSSSEYVYASPAGVPSICMLNIASRGGEMRSSFGMNSGVMAMPRRRKRGMHLAEQLLVRSRVEVVQKIRNQNDVVAGAKIHFKGAAGDGGIAIRDAGLAGVFFRHFQHIRPVQADHFRVRVLLGEGDSVQAMAGGDIEHFDGLRTREHLRDQFGRHLHHGRHGPRELHPHGIFGFQSAVIAGQRSAVADNVR